MKRNRITSFLLAAVTASALFALPAMAAEADVFPYAEKVKTVKTGVVYVKESDDRGMNISIDGSKATLVFEIENNKDYVYQWEYLNEEGGWNLIGGANGSVYPIRNLKSGKTYTIRVTPTLRSNGQVIVPSKQINLTVE